MYNYLIILFATSFLFKSQLYWYWNRFEENGGLGIYLAIIFSFFFAIDLKNKSVEGRSNLYHLTVFLVLLFLAKGVLPNIIVMLSLVILLLFAFVVCLKKRIDLNHLMLICFCLPWLSSMHFYFGYPMRKVCSYFSILYFNCTQLTVGLKGVVFSYNDQLIYIDGPCSGINMLYSGLLLTAILCNVYHIRFLYSLCFMFFSFILILASNTMRYIYLVYNEIGLYNMPVWMHEGIGLVLFLIYALVCVSVIHYRLIILEKIKEMIFVIKLNLRKETSERV